MLPMNSNHTAVQACTVIAVDASPRRSESRGVLKKRDAYHRFYSVLRLAHAELVEVISTHVRAPVEPCTRP